MTIAHIAEIVGRALIAYLFVWTGIYNWSQPERVRFNTEHLRGRGVPYPSFVLHEAFGRSSPAWRSCSASGSSLPSSCC